MRWWRTRRRRGRTKTLEWRERRLEGGGRPGGRQGWSQSGSGASEGAGPPRPRTTSHSLRLLGHKTLGEIPSRQLSPPGSPRGPSRRSTRVASVHSSAEKGLSVSLGLGDPHHPSEQGLWAARFSNLMGKPEANRDTVPSGVRGSPQLSLSRSRAPLACLAQVPASREPRRSAPADKEAA